MLQNLQNYCKSHPYLVGGCLLALPILKLVRNYFNSPFYKGKKDVKGKIVIVTGSSAGLGKETAFDLLENGATVIFACRDKIKTINVINTILDPKAKERAVFMKLDLCSVQSVYDFAKEFKSYYNELDILVNNAGIMADEYTITKDGIESSLEGNHIGHMVLTSLLMDVMSKQARIINISSRAHIRSNFTLEEVKRLESNLDFKGEEVNFNFTKQMIHYGNTKICNIFFTQYLAEILEKKCLNIKTASVHPGIVQTEFTRFANNFPFYVRFLFYCFMPLIYLLTKSSIAGAQTQLALCYMDYESMQCGQYYTNTVRTDTSEMAKNKEIRQEVMKYSWTLIDKITLDKDFKVPKFD